MSESFVEAAFHLACEDAKPAEGFYVSLMEESSYYGGPEEGGWWGTDSRVVAYKHFDTEEAADAAQAATRALAEELEKQSLKDHGDYCLRTLEMLEARGLEPDYLPEDDGPSRFFICVSEGLPQASFGPRGYS